MYFYKREDIKNKSKYNNIINSELSNDNYYEIIVKNVPNNIRLDFDYKHESCFFTTSTITEKRLCRCLVCYNTKNAKTQCDKCSLKANNFFSKSVLNAKMLDFEIPVSSSSTDKIGEIDILFEYCGDVYVGEFKPIWNKESLLRMVSEILTYTHVLKTDNKAFMAKYNIAKYEKAILFVKGSEQWKQWVEREKYMYYACDRLREIIKKEQISVFCLELKEEGYYLEKLN